MGFLKSFIQVVRDPTRTEAIFRVISNPLVTNEQTYKIVLTHLEQDPLCARMIQSRHLGKWSIDDLSELKTSTLGFAYAQHMKTNGLKPDFFPELEIKSPHEYIQMRSRQTHDIWHVMTGFSTSIEDEAGLQAFVYAQLRSPSSIVIIAMLMLHACFFNHALVSKILDSVSRGWTLGKRAKNLFGENFEARWEDDLQSYKARLNLAW